MACGQAGNIWRHGCEPAVLGARPEREGRYCLQIPNPPQAGAVAHALQGFAARLEANTGLICNIPRPLQDVGTGPGRTGGHLIRDILKPLQGRARRLLLGQSGGNR